MPSWPLVAEDLEEILECNKGLIHINIRSHIQNVTKDSFFNDIINVKWNWDKNTMGNMNSRLLSTWKGLTQADKNGHSRPPSHKKSLALNTAEN